VRYLRRVFWLLRGLEEGQRKRLKKSMKECELSAPVMEWFNEREFDVFVEVSPPYVSATFVDLVACHFETGTVIAIELKTSLTKKVLRQAYTHTLFADAAYVAVGSNPRKLSLEKCRKAGVGVIRVRPEVAVVLRPRMKHPPFWGYKEKILDRLILREPGGVAGLPTLKGEGPAQQCYELVLKYRKRYPDATWKDIFRDVPNHYSSYRSMCGAMRVVEIKRNAK
jgi:hypothetical protein